MFDYDSAELGLGDTARLIAEQHRARMVAECQILELAAHWADLHSGPADPGARGNSGERERMVGGAGTPRVLEFAAAEFGALVETTTNGAWELIGDALDLRHRLPRLWAAVRSGRVRVWKARRIAHETRHLTQAAAGRVDAELDGLVNALSWTRLEAVLAAKIAEADPVGEEARAAAYEAERFVRAGRASQHGLKLMVARAAAGDVIWFLATVARIAEILSAEGDEDQLDVRRSKAIGILSRPERALELLRRHAAPPGANAVSEPDPEGDEHVSLVSESRQSLDPRLARPRVELVVHVATETLARDGGPVRIEGAGPTVLGQVRRWLFGADCSISLRPVVDLTADSVAVDAYEIPRSLRRLSQLRNPTSVFPYSSAIARASGRGLDLDHTVPYLPPDRGGPPGQTNLGNLGPLSRSEHRLKTHSGWRVRQPEPGAFVWRSPSGHHWITSACAGTFPLGSGPLATAIWHAISAGETELAA